MTKRLCLLLCCCIFLQLTHAQDIILEKKATGAFPIVSPGGSARIIVDERGDSLILKVAQLFQQDVEAVTGERLSVHHRLQGSSNIILIGNIHSSALIKTLAREKKLDVSKLQNKWEAYHVQIVKRPFPGISQALVIAGSDPRGTAYALLEVSKQAGVSPWYWWADVPIKKKQQLYVKANALLADAPKIKYRGIFINDEAPALSNWAKEKFGGFNHQFYGKVFELMLRLKANYLWPAMWGNAFYDDDILNMQAAKNYGIVIGTSHHEPLMRAHDEWRRYGNGKWNYDSNAVQLDAFWKTGLQRATNEKIVTIGMRGDGDEPMSEQTATSLLERIVKDQRKIIQDVTGKPAAQTPQLWALYKEVQDYYDKGMSVPDDVTLLLCDDNWGNIRKLPKLGAKPRSGGYGIYYHFDYVGGPRNYKWINTNNISRVWEQMSLAWEYKARQIWIANVGDIKPMELPISFFLDYAWNPEKWNEDNIHDYFREWAAAQFGTVHAVQIGEVLSIYSQLSARRKPELLNEKTYSIDHYNEAGRVQKEWSLLLQQAEQINVALPIESRDAFFQLVLHPVKAFANLHSLYVAAAYNQKLAAEKDPAANRYADDVHHHYKIDSLLTETYHRSGKWNHMMSQTHIGYTYWQQPLVNKMPLVTYLTADADTEDMPKVELEAYTAASLIPKPVKGNVFYEYEGYVSIDAAHPTRAVNNKQVEWKNIPGIGRDGDGVTTFPRTISASSVYAGSPQLQYDIYTYDSGTVKVNAYFSPTLNFHNSRGMQYAISIDDEHPQVIIINKESDNLKSWSEWVANNIIIKSSKHHLVAPGKHTVKYWMISGAVVVQKIVLDFGGLQPSYLGPPETRWK